MNKHVDSDPAQTIKMWKECIFAPLLQLQTVYIDIGVYFRKKNDIQSNTRHCRLKSTKQVTGKKHTVCNRRQTARTGMLSNPNETAKAKRYELLNNAVKLTRQKH